MKYRVPIFIAVLLITVVILILAQLRLASMQQDADMLNCDKVKQCLKADSTWPSKMQYCPAALAPLTVRKRSQNGKWGYAVDLEGCITEQIVAPRFDVAEKFGNNGLAKVRDGEKWGYINLKGEEAVPFHFDEVGDFSYGLAPIKSNGKWGYFDAQRQSIIHPVFDAVSGIWRDSLSAAEDNGKWGYINLAGDRVIPFRFDHVTEFSEGVAKVELNGKWGLIDLLGNTVIPLDFDVIFSTADPGLLLVVSNHKYGYFNAKGQVIIPPCLVKPVQMRRDGSGAIQIHLNEFALTAANGAIGSATVPVNGWFYLDATNEKVRFDENGKVQLWRKGAWFYINGRGQLIPSAMNG
jgi:hypothetical protein